MIERKRVLLREGRLQAGAALGLAGVIVGVIAEPSWTRSEVAIRLAIGGVIVFAIALALGSMRLVGAATLPVLGAALIASAAAGDPAWVRSIVLGILWYIAAELAWHAIERRDGAERSRALNNRRIDEVAVVVSLSLVVTTAGFLSSFLAPVRTALAVGIVILGLFAALSWATRHVSDSTLERQGASSAERARHAEDSHD